MLESHQVQIGFEQEIKSPSWASVFQEIQSPDPYLCISCSKHICTFVFHVQRPSIHMDFEHVRIPGTYGICISCPIAQVYMVFEHEIKGTYPI